MGFYTHVDNFLFIFSLVLLLLAEAGIDPFFMRFILICFDHFYFFFTFFGLHNPCINSLMDGQVQRDFVCWKLLNQYKN